MTANQTAPTLTTGGGRQVQHATSYSVRRPVERRDAHRRNVERVEQRRARRRLDHLLGVPPVARTTPSTWAMGDDRRRDYARALVSVEPYPWQTWEVRERILPPGQRDDVTEAVPA